VNATGNPTLRRVRFQFSVGSGFAVTGFVTVFFVDSPTGAVTGDDHAMLRKVLTEEAGGLDPKRSSLDALRSGEVDGAGGDGVLGRSGGVRRDRYRSGCLGQDFSRSVSPKNRPSQARHAVARQEDAARKTAAARPRSRCMRSARYSVTVLGSAVNCSRPMRAKNAEKSRQSPALARSGLAARASSAALASLGT
jgi:hypothetical protein